MSEFMQFRQRLLRAGLGLALLGLAGHPALAQDKPAAPTPAADNVTVVRDAETGALRPATAAEQAVLQAANARRVMRAAPVPMQQKFHGSGARGVRLTDEFMTSSVAVRKPDGSLEMQCLEGHGDAKAAPHTHAPQSDTE
ncbi:post-PEP-CTERM-1 domain-containing protein [Massilia niastensis]|uniref:post-PEP-CTERM-1 domain-containing protein n=1 Tax=Massilia niastensis TaxID=544911 RepID=UPI00035C2FDC|nr:hypothetical protein [Massilia niastensis]